MSDFLYDTRRKCPSCGFRGTSVYNEAAGPTHVCNSCNYRFPACKHCLKCTGRYQFHELYPEKCCHCRRKLNDLQKAAAEQIAGRFKREEKCPHCGETFDKSKEKWCRCGPPECDHSCHTQGANFCTDCYKRHPELKYPSCPKAFNAKHCFTWKPSCSKANERTDWHVLHPRTCCLCGFIQFDLPAALAQRNLHEEFMRHLAEVRRLESETLVFTQDKVYKIPPTAVAMQCPCRRCQNERASRGPKTFGEWTRSYVAKARSYVAKAEDEGFVSVDIETLGHRPWAAEYSKPVKERKATMFIAQLKSIKDQIDRIDVDEMVVLAAAAKQTSESYESFQLPVPEWLQEAQVTLNKEIKFRRRDQLEKELKQARARKEALKSAEEKKTDLDAQIKKLEAALGE